MFVINLAFEPPDRCRVTVEGQSYALPADELALLTALKPQAALHPAARVDGNVAIPYKCFGHAVFVAQRAGFKRVGFIAEPPKTDARP